MFENILQNMTCTQCIATHTCITLFEYKHSFIIKGYVLSRYFVVFFAINS